MARDHEHDGFASDWFAEWASETFGSATDRLNRAIETKPEVGWDLILMLVGAAPDDDALAWVAAGPLEDLLCEHGPAFISRAEALAQSDKRFRACLALVWGSNRMEAGVYERMCHVAPGKRA